MAALLRLIHPAEFFQCFQLSKRIAKSVPLNHRQTVLDLLELWASPFHCMQIIVNRETINHRDTRGWALGYDLLATFGNYNNGILSLPTIGLECLYNPGTVTGLMGKVFIHGVQPVNGERLCFAQFVRPGVFARAFPGRPEPEPPRLSLVKNIGVPAGDFHWEAHGGTPSVYTFTPMSVTHR